MWRSAVSALVLCLVYEATVVLTNEKECGVHTNQDNAISLHVSSRKNSTGDWVTDFSLNKDDNGVRERYNRVTLDLKQDVVECRGKMTLQIRGSLAGISSGHFAERLTKDSKDNLHFHTRCGSNAAILSDGRTIQRIDSEKDGNALVLTHRTLKSNEILEVKLVRKHTKFTHSLGIGVTTLSPNAASSFVHINNIQNVSWALYDGKMFHNGKPTLEGYGKNTNSLSVGERVGVMRSHTGSLHYFVNGEDQGPAASNVPEEVYGVVELRGHALVLQIVDA